MLTLALGLLSRFWKPLLLVGLLLAGAFFVNRWDNKRLDHAFEEGRKAAFSDLDREERRIIKRSEEISQENARELNFLENQVELKREVVYEQVNTYIKETVIECKPDPEYLRLYDAATRTSDILASTIGPQDRTIAITQVPTPVTSKPEL